MNDSPPDIHALPSDLPVPEDDGAADHLQGATVPSIVLSATVGGAVDLAEAARGTLVVYVYPKTGVRANRSRGRSRGLSSA